MGLGEWAGLATAALWAISSLFYAKVRLGAWTLNFAKNAIGCAILGGQLVLVAWWTSTPILNASAETWSLMALSGLIGILIGDTFFFRCLQVLGPRRALMLATTTPLFAAALGWIFFGESIDVRRAGGIVLTLAGVGIVISDQRANIEAPGLYPGAVWVGALCGILGALCQAIGAAIAKQGMTDCDAATATFIRLLVASWLGFLLISQTRSIGRRDKQNSIRANLGALVPGAMLGTWLGIWFSQIAIKYSDIAVATTLMTTCPLFAIPLVRAIHKHPIRPLAIVGTLLAIAGVYFVAS
jgi:drug/metabolite transporter (DMT)-like permease